jgi:hypothetical protein
MEKIVWNYWENRPGHSQPPHIALCQEILRRRLGSCRQELITPANLRDYLPDIHPNIEKITRADRPDEPCLATKADFIRVLLLEKYGGFWIDSDAIVLKNIDTVFEKFQNHEFVATRRTSSPKQHIPNNFFGTVPGGRIITAYADQIREALDQQTSYVWNEVGSFMLTPIVNANLSTAYLYPERWIQPLVAGQQPLYMDEEVQFRDIVSPDAIVFMLFHRIFEGTHHKVGVGLRDYSIDELYNTNMLIGKVFREAMPRDWFEQWRSSAVEAVPD